MTSRVSPASCLAPAGPCGSEPQVLYFNTVATIFIPCCGKSRLDYFLGHLRRAKSAWLLIFYFLFIIFLSVYISVYLSVYLFVSSICVLIVSRVLPRHHCSLYFSRSIFNVIILQVKSILTHQTSHLFFESHTLIASDDLKRNFINSPTFGTLHCFN